MIRKSTTAIGLLGGSVLLASVACGEADQLGDLPREDSANQSAKPPTEQSNEMVSTSSPLTRGKAIADDLVELLETDHSVSEETLKQKLETLATSFDHKELTAEEQLELDAYVRTTFAPVKDRLKALLDTPESIDTSSRLQQLGGGTCYTRCAFVAEYACENSQYVGFCVGFWGCDAGMGVHECFGSDSDDTGPAGCDNDSECAPGWRCAKWAFKPNECVKTCDSNADCPGSQKCKKPLGTSFKRCK